MHRQSLSAYGGRGTRSTRRHGGHGVALHRGRLAERKARLSPPPTLHVAVIAKDVKLDCGFRLDLVVEAKVIVEVKSLAQVAPVHRAQLLTYLVLTGCPAGLLINFNVPVLKDGVTRVLNTRT